MALVRRSAWDPFNSLIRQMDRDFDQLSRRVFGTFSGGYVPAADVEQDGRDVVVKLDLPGIDVGKDVEVEISEGRLVISGRRGSEETRENENMVLREIRSGSFRREFDLPEGVTADQVDAEYDRGVLKVRIRDVSKPVTEPTKIEIKGTGGGPVQVEGTKAD